MQGIKLPPIIQTSFSNTEIEMYKTQLLRQHGASAKVISLSGLSHQTYIRAMRGEPIKISTKKKLSKAIMKVIEQNIKPPTQ